jgi:pimeloyl-ACP methyl ester carboxylesterase
VLPGAGHMVTYTAPDRLVREVEALAEAVRR